VKTHSLVEGTRPGVVLHACAKMHWIRSSASAFLTVTLIDCYHLFESGPFLAF